MRLQATSTGRGKSAAFTQVQRPPRLAPETRSFTTDERLAMGQEMAEKNILLMRKEEEKRSIMSQYKADMDALASQANALAEKVKAGYEMRDTRCKITLDYGANTKVVAVESTGAIVDSISPIPEADRQLDALALGEGEEEAQR